MIMVPMAVDAGLGEMGRFGYLISKSNGSMIRLSGVTTDMPLAPDKPIDSGVQHFCKVCKKCATTCPSDSIPMDNKKTEVNGSLRWKIDEVSCFQWWGQVGSAYAICTGVCPYGHAPTWPHKVIRFLSTRNPINRHLLHLGDILFYGWGRKRRALPEWIDLGTSIVKELDV